jgi:hypothetical protein
MTQIGIGSKNINRLYVLSRAAGSPDRPPILKRSIHAAARRPHHKRTHSLSTVDLKRAGRPNPPQNPLTLIDSQQPSRRNHRKPPPNNRHEPAGQPHQLVRESVRAGRAGQGRGL